MTSIPKPVWISSAAASLVGLTYLIKDSFSGKMYEGKEKLTNKIVIVTGANTGIGKEVALDLARREAKVIMACRNLFKCETTRKEIVLSTKNKYVYCKECDLASQESIRKFVDTFKKEHSELHLLINNAGVMRCPKSVTEDGIETQLGVNHMGHFLLTNLLLETLKKSAPSRIVNVSSTAHLRGKIKVKDLNSSENYDPGDAYAQSKLANVLFTKELSKRLAGTGVAAFAVHPGLVETEITRHMSFFNSTLGAILLKPLFWLFVKPPKHGAQPVIHAALAPKLKNESGLYFSNFDEAEVSEEAKNDQLAKWLWMTSEKWTKLKTS
ncbi:retinol dehydrogenase 13-like [Venturia canescens]|uniref:retinol dehydrogenase 13-like n=1 Tax=Venturia canescens TaxID=32260 RepID=UPI001C9D075B|nr:retinol dehydrogenase 13-like [Venturia canescens]